MSEFMSWIGAGAIFLLGVLCGFVVFVIVALLGAPRLRGEGDDDA